MKRMIIFLISLLLFAAEVLGQGAIVTVKVTDAATGEALLAAYVSLERDGVTRLSKTTDEAGECMITNLKPADYNLKIRYLGYITQRITGIGVRPGDSLHFEVIMKQDTTSPEAVVEVVEFRKPLFEKDMTTSDIRFSIESPKESTVIKSSSSYTPDDSYAPAIEGSRKSGETYFIDGVRVSGETTHPGIKAGMLTAGEVNDFGKWELWQDITENELKQWQDLWKMKPLERYSVQLVNENRLPVTGAEVILQDKAGVKLWSSKTDNTGKAELWTNLYADADEKGRTLTVTYNGKKHRFEKPDVFHKGVNVYKLPVSCELPDAVDIAFVVDATGSMGDEINYLKEEIRDVISRFKDSMKDCDIRTGSVFYRDKTDVYLTKVKDFTPSVTEIEDFIKAQAANGGGDYPEAVDAALEAALGELSWRAEARTKILFLVLDAPPHQDPQVVQKMQELTAKAARQGIRIVPVAASGTNKSTEYLMRSMALATNGTYLFLTDHSGIGNPHIEPTTDEYTVEMLNDLLLRVMVQFSKAHDCNQQSLITQIKTDTSQVLDQQPRDTTLQPTDSSVAVEPKFNWKYYPNPTSGIFYVELDSAVQEIFIFDMAGKIISRILTANRLKVQIDISQFPAGMYLVKFEQNNKWYTGKLVMTSAKGSYGWWKR